MFYCHFCLNFHYYAGVLSVFQVFSILRVICGETKQNKQKTKEMKRFSLKATIMAFAMEVATRRKMCPTFE